jgi:hypothetical protein
MFYNHGLDNKFKTNETIKPQTKYLNKRVYCKIKMVMKLHHTQFDILYKKVIECEDFLLIENK